MKRSGIITLLLIVALLVMFITDLTFGTTYIPLKALFTDDGINRTIMLDLRLPRALTALMAGAALSMSGLMMQTLFRNPLAGPYILGVSSGATFGVGMLVLLGIMFSIVATNLLTITAAIIGATLCLMLVLAISYKVENNVSLLIIGMMIGSIVGALVNIMQNFANPDVLKLFVVWSLGSLSAVTWHELPYLVPVFAVGFVLSLLLVKPLNGLLLGENYARSLGINVSVVRMIIVLTTGVLAGAITAFCGPIAFVGVAVPHIARGLYHTSNHRITIPVSALVGANLLLLCDLLSNQFTYPLPISALSAIFGAPVIIYIILKNR